MYKVFETRRLTDEDDDKGRTDFCEGAFQYLEDIGKKINTRIYIGPGRDGSSDEKIALDFKFNPMNTKVSFPKAWQHQGYVTITGKTTDATSRY